MTERDLHYFIKCNFPQENESCDWKAWSNLKNSINSHEGDDMISYVSAISNMNGGTLVVGIEDETLNIIGIKAFGNYNAQSIKLRLLELCPNLPSEGLVVNEYIAEDTNKIVWVVNIPKHAPRRPVLAHNKVWQRVGDSLVEMMDDRYEAILHEVIATEDWSAEIVEEATLEDLDERAIARAKSEYAKRNPDRYEELQNWDTLTFLNKAKLAKRGKLTRTALLLLGREESDYLLSPYVAEIRWELKTAANENKDYHIFHIPLLLAVDEVYNKIRNTRYAYLNYGSLFPEEMLRYEPFNIRESINNCIAHQDYTCRARIEVMEFEDDRLIFQNNGTFLPKSVEDVVRKDCPESVYRNHYLVEAMRNLNMIETEGGGIKKMFQNQRRRLFPMPDYDTTDNKVRVEIIGKVVNEDFARLLTNVPNLNISDIILLDKVQKRKPLNDDEIIYLRRQQYIEGRKPNFYLSYKVINPTNSNNLRTEYINNRNFDDAHYKDLILKYIKRYKSAKKTDINRLIIDKLSPVLSDKQKISKVQNLLSALRMEGKIEYVERSWRLKI